MFQSLTDDFASSPPSKKPRGGDSSGKSRGKDAQMKCTTVKEIPKKQARSTFFLMNLHCQRGCGCHHHDMV